MTSNPSWIKLLMQESTEVHGSEVLGSEGRYSDVPKIVWLLCGRHSGGHSRDLNSVGAQLVFEEGEWLDFSTSNAFLLREVVWGPPAPGQASQLRPALCAGSGRCRLSWLGGDGQRPAVIRSCRGHGHCSLAFLHLLRFPF